MSSQSNQSSDPLDPDHRDDLGKGNRPADGARQSTPGEVFSDTFHGSDAAGDFLGLDVDMEAMYQAGSEEEALDLAQPLDLQAGPSAAWDPDNEPLALNDLDPANVLAGDPQLEGASQSAHWGDQDALAVEELDDSDFEDEGFQPVVRSGSSNRWALVALPFAVGAIAVAGVVLFPRVMDHGEALNGIEIARNSQEAKAALESKLKGAIDDDAKVVESSPVDSEGAASQTEPVQGGSSTDNPTTTTSTDSGELVQAEVNLSGEGGMALGEMSGPEALPPGLDELIGELVNEAQGGPGSSRTGHSGSERSASTTSGSTTAGTDRVASLEGQAGRAKLLSTEPWSVSEDAEWNVIWQGDTVPTESMGSAQQILTPRVGSVRVLMNSGEIFDGKLYAVGQDRLWLDTKPGRIGLDGGRIAGIERLEAHSMEANASTSVVMGERVKISVPGGHLFGSVLAKEANGTVTVAIENGGRITLAGAEIQPLGKSRVRVIR